MKQDDLILCAFRYCLGRMSYIVSSMAEHLEAHWDELNPHIQKLIIEEIKWAVERGAAGMACDIEQWESLVKHVSSDPEATEDSDRNDGKPSGEWHPAQCIQAGNPKTKKMRCPYNTKVI